MEMITDTYVILYMKIVINSHAKSNIALQHLLESLKENDINYCDVIDLSL